MSENKQTLEEALFEMAAQKPDQAGRAAFLDGVCRDNPALRARLERLLQGHFASEGFLTSLPEREAFAPTVAALPPSESPTPMLGRYKLLEKIGEGGFGEVWMAEQREPVKRRVALKIIKLGMDSKQIVARFEAERQALAMMDHANIAKIFDADVTETGRPYFAMELVRGIKITEYCDQNQLDTRQRLDLFIKVCQAIQHAHQKGVIHRDIKPSNILVTLHDGVPVPKVIDFGIAKATQQELTDKTVFTQFQQFIGTPAYISPEQAEMSGLDIDTRADIYSLGVLLYELLVGQTPFDAKEMMKGGIDALRQIIREREPLRPSTKLNTLPGEDRTTAGKRRHTDAAKLVHQLRGDLDWIVLKCLEKDRTRRYDTANGLAADIQRHLSHEPVVARPPSTAYKIQKAWQRNKLAYSAAAAVALALVAGTAVSTWQAYVATRARSAAQKAEALAVAKEQEAKAQQERADREAAIARRTAYNASLSSVQADWEKRNYARVRETLASQQDYAEPSFEWFYWQRMTHLEQSSFPTHAGGIHAFSLSPDRTRVALVMKDNSIEIRSVPSGEKLASFLGHGTLLSDRPHQNDLAQNAVFSPDGRFVASCGGLFGWGVIKLWNAQTGEEIRSFGEFSGGDNPDRPVEPVPGVRNRQNTVAFSPDGRLLASGGASGGLGVMLWEVATGKMLRNWKTAYEHFWIEQVAFSPDGQRLFYRAVDGSLGMCGVESGALLALMPGGQDATGVSSFALSPDSRRLAVHRGHLVVYDLTAEGFSKVLLESSLDPDSHGLAFSPDGKRLIAYGRGDSVIYDSFTGEKQLTLRGGSSQSRFLADSQRIISTDGDRRIKIWDAATHREQIRIDTGYFPAAIARDGSRLVVHLIPGASGDRKASPGLGAEEAGTGGLRRASDNRQASQGLGVVEASTGKLISSMREHVPSLVEGAAFSPDGQWVVSGARDGTFRVWDALAGHVKRTVKTPQSEHGTIGFGSKADIIVSRVRDSLRIDAIAGWDIATGQQTFSPRRWDRPGPWAMSPDGLRLATGHYDGTVRVLDPATGGDLKHWQAHEPQQFEAMMGHHNECMDYSADGRHLATAGFDGLVKLWDPETGKLERVMTGHSGGVVGVHFTPDQRRLISQGRDGTVRIWDPAAGKELLSLTDPLFAGVWTWYVAVSPDGRKVVSAPGHRSELIIWEGATPGQMADWRREEEADAALWAAEQPKVEARRLARLHSGAKK